MENPANRNKANALWMVVCALVAMSSPVFAIPLTFDVRGVTDSNNRAHVVFEYMPATASVHLTITNTSLNFDPRLTAFAFNLPGQVAGISSFSGPSGWVNSLTVYNTHTPGGYGLFDLAYLTGPNLNEGLPNAGITQGSTVSFNFRLQGSGLESLDESSFLSLLSFNPFGPTNQNRQYFIARFQRTGTYGYGSDIGTPSQDGRASPVPEPAGLLLLGTGLVGLAGFGRRFWKRHKRSVVGRKE